MSLIARHRRWSFVLAACLICLLLLAAFWLARQIRIDKCLDNGGRWNYDKFECQY